MTEFVTQKTVVTQFKACDVICSGMPLSLPNGVNQFAPLVLWTDCAAWNE
ncbi:hypothetical protein [Novipirellula caenicola]